MSTREILLIAAPSEAGQKGPPLFDETSHRKIDSANNPFNLAHNMTFTFNMAEHWKDRVHEDARARVVTENTTHNCHSLTKKAFKRTDHAPSP